MAGLGILDLFLVPNVNKYPSAGSKPTLLEEKETKAPVSYSKSGIFLSRNIMSPSTV